MTRYTTAQIEQLRKDAVGKTITDLSYEPEDNYYVMTFEDGEGKEAEFSFRFMADL